MNKWTKIVQYVRTGCKFLFNDLCQICYQTNKCHAEICKQCYSWLPWLRHSCHVCAYPIGSENQVCIQCLERPLAGCDAVKALFRYESPIKQYVYQLKYHQKLQVARFFAQLLATHLEPGKRIDAILPVPLAKDRLKSRGYNQSLEVAKLLAKQLNIPCYPAALVKLRVTKQQSDLNKHQRMTNLTPRDFNLVYKLQGKNVLLIDDVFTTGRTMQCIAMALKSHGICYVEAWAICRSI